MPDYAGPSRRLPRQTWSYVLLVLVFAILSAFLLYPIFLTVRGAFIIEGDTSALEYFGLILSDSWILGGLFNAFAIATATTLICIIISLPLAVFSAKYKYPLKGAFNALILVPLILPPFVGALGLQAILGREGAMNALLGTDWDLFHDAKFWGVVICEALHLYPIIYLNATAALANLDPALDEAAENLGAGTWRRFFRITLPLIRPGLFAGATIVFIWSLTELGTPLVFDFRQVTPAQIFLGLKEVETSPEPYVLTVIMLVAAISTYALGRFVFGRRGHAMYSKASRAGGEMTLPPLAGIGVTALFGFVTFLALLPHIGVVLTSFSEVGAWYKSIIPRHFTLSHYETALQEPVAYGSIVNSLKLASGAVILDLLIGLAVGYLIVRTTVRGRSLLDALCMLPLAVPGLVLAFGYVAMTLQWPFGKGGPLDGTWFDLQVLGTNPNPMPLLVIAYAVRRLPYIVRATVAGLEQTSGELEEAAMNLGASRLTAVRKIIVPLIMANLIAGALLAFSFAMLEVSDSLILAQRQEHFPITRAIYAFLLRIGDGPYIASAMGVWGMALLAVALVGASMLIGRKLGSIFRV